jgi:hypothetical protein
VIDRPSEPVSLAAPGFESLQIARPSYSLERSMQANLTHPGRVNAHSFVTALLTGCLMPHRTVVEIEALDATDRARLRRALVDVCEEQPRWRALYGTHLNGDERLLATMVWRHRRQTHEVRKTLAAIVARRGELTRNATTGIAEVASSQITAKLLRSELALAGHAQRALAGYASVTQPHLALAKSMPLGLQPNYLKALGASPGILQIGTGVSPDRTLGVLGIGEPSWLKALSGAHTKIGIASASRTLLGASGITGVTGSLLPSFAGAMESINRPFELMRKAWAGFEEVDRFIAAWEQDALWLLFAKVHIGATRGMANLTRAEVEAIVLDALEPICSNAKYIEALRAEVAKAPYLSSSQRVHLDHMLEHAQQREYVKASGSLYFGLEGAYREAAYASSQLARPTGTKKALGFEKLVKLMALPAELQTFIVRAVFGGAGNTVRHGAADGVERRQVLLGIVALAGWLELFAGAPALELLSEYLSATLPQTIEKTQTPALAPGSP